VQEGQGRTGGDRESEGLPEHSTLCESPNMSCCAVLCHVTAKGREVKDLSGYRERHRMTSAHVTYHALLSSLPSLPFFLCCVCRLGTSAMEGRKDGLPYAALSVTVI
jgi:hypothetical protein